MIQHFSHCKTWSGENCNCEEAALEQQFKLGLLSPVTTEKTIKFRLTGRFEDVMKAYREIMGNKK